MGVWGAESSWLFQRLQSTLPLSICPLLFVRRHSCRHMRATSLLGVSGGSSHHLGLSLQLDCCRAIKNWSHWELNVISRLLGYTAFSAWSGLNVLQRQSRLITAPLWPQCVTLDGLVIKCFILSSAVRREWSNITRNSREWPEEKPS